ncbi:Exostosin-like [Arabidopsis thaliana x Arabidopsis arenosa]|uniref:Exostosin-like n=1 Tax=Arabidopsis thaliana x Arabidopsis arenosa TaxID=1240361 RepID=A0A8T2A618_9BRAS|nr:Exostosin-like [Arabidopsis thaliana x Arabidopsis arenosa]
MIMEKFNPKKKKIVRKRALKLLTEILPTPLFSMLFLLHINQIANYLFLSDKETLNIIMKAKQGGTDTCAGRYVYMHNLPSRFNDDLIKSCEAYIELRNKCKYLVNSGFGPRILEDKHNHTTQVLTIETGSWYYTNQFMLEVIFGEKMRHYECLTNDSALSSAVFVPFYAGFDVRRFWGYSVKLRDKLGEDLAQWLRERPEWRKMFGRDHFFVTGRVGRDFRRVTDEDSDWGNKLMRLPEFKNITMLSIETNSWGNEFAVPYPTYFHPKSHTEVKRWQMQVRMMQRRYLFSFVGANRPKMEDSIRGEIIRQCRASQGSCKYLDCDTSTKDCSDPVKVMEVFQDSVFCLQPPGDTPTRRSIFDSILAGCIPVLFSPDSVYNQYKWYFPKDHTKYSVYISEEDVKNGKVSIEKLLASISEERIVKMRNEVEKIIPKIIYTKPGAVGPEKIEDAFEIAVARVLERVSLFKMTRI